MFKEIKLPEISADYIDISAITRDTEGVIIGFKDNEAACYIYATDDMWGAYNSIYIDSTIGEEPTLVELVNRLIADNVIDSLKLIEF